MNYIINCGKIHDLYLTEYGLKLLNLEDKVRKTALDEWKTFKEANKEKTGDIPDCFIEINQKVLDMLDDSARVFLYKV